jgi:hypothetical protein
VKKIILLALAIRVIGIIIFRNVDNYDLQSYLQVGELTLKGENIYPKIANLHHPYFPLFLYVEALGACLGRLGGLGRLGTILILKLIVSLFDLGNVYLVYLLSKKNLNTAFLYAINPVLILIFTLHGQFDAIPIFFFLYSLHLIKVRKEAFSILFLSTGIMVKTWPLLFFIPIYKRLKLKKLIVLVLILPTFSIVIYSLFFKANIFDIGKTIVSYQGLWGLWGPWIFLTNIRLRWQKLFIGIFLLAFFLFSFLKNSKSVFKEIRNLLFFFYVFTPTFSIQYFSWLIPFLTIVKPKNYWQIVMSVAGYLALSYLSWRSTLINQSVLMIWGFILWFYLASVFWMAYRKKYFV